MKAHFLPRVGNPDNLAGSVRAVGSSLFIYDDQGRSITIPTEAGVLKTIDRLSGALLCLRSQIGAASKIQSEFEESLKS